MRHTVVALVLAVMAAGCNQVVPIHVLEPVDVTTGWHDACILEDGNNKIVPSRHLKLRTKSECGDNGVDAAPEQRHDGRGKSTPPPTCSRSRGSRNGAPA